MARSDSHRQELSRESGAWPGRREGGVRDVLENLTLTELLVPVQDSKYCLITENTSNLASPPLSLTHCHFIQTSKILSFPLLLSNIFSAAPIFVVLRILSDSLSNIILQIAF